MLNLQEVESTIKELEEGPTTLESCRKLAVLYIVRENNKNANLRDFSALQPGDTVVEQEYSEILPSYREFCEIKRKFQLHEIPKEGVMEKLSLLCIEIQEFLNTLYITTHSPEERELIERSLSSLSFNPL